jgi:hypothetical protein
MGELEDSDTTRRQDPSVQSLDSSVSGQTISSITLDSGLVISAGKLGEHEFRAEGDMILRCPDERAPLVVRYDLPRGRAPVCENLTELAAIVSETILHTRVNANGALELVMTHDLSLLMGQDTWSYTHHKERTQPYPEIFGGDPGPREDTYLPLRPDATDSAPALSIDAHSTGESLGGPIQDDAPGTPNRDRELFEGRELAASGQSVTAVTLDSNVVLLAGPDREHKFRIEDDIVLRRAGESRGRVVRYEPYRRVGPVRENLTDLASIVTQTIVHARAYMNGALELVMSNDDVLSVGPAEQYEAWTYVYGTFILPSGVGGFH